MSDVSVNPAESEFLVGAAAIARFLGITERAVFHWSSKSRERDRLPVRKFGGKLIATKADLRRVLAPVE